MPTYHVRGLDRHITGNYGEDLAIQSDPELDELLDGEEFDLSDLDFVVEMSIDD